MAEKMDALIANRLLKKWVGEGKGFRDTLRPTRAVHFATALIFLIFFGVVCLPCV